MDEWQTLVTSVPMTLEDVKTPTDVYAGSLPVVVVPQ